MGVQIYLLDRRRVTLIIGGNPQEIGTLHRSWKVTEMNNERAAEINAADARIQGKAAPLAVMVADVSQLPLAAPPCQTVAAHLVLGWDADRSSVTDLGWDYLPVLGYAVRHPSSMAFILHEMKDGLLSPVSESRGIEIGAIDEAGHMVRRGQPTIKECLSIRPYISGYVAADCLLSDSETAELLTALESDNPPDIAWYAEKRPADIAYYGRRQGFNTQSIYRNPSFPLG